MSHKVDFEFKRSPVYRKGTDGKNTYTAVASTDALDRDREILVPRGVLIENFMKNPVMLNIHQMKHVPVGRVLSVSIDEKSVKFDFEFYDDEISAGLERMYQTGFMNAFSVGFLPKAYVPVWNLDDTVTSVAVELPDGTSQTIDFSKYAVRPWGIIPQWELLEISPVPVPSNPEALLQRSADVIIRKCVDGNKSKALAQIVEAKVAGEVADLAKQISDFLGKMDETLQLTGVVEYEKGDASEAEFVAVDVLGNMAIACSSDQSGEPEKIDWAKFAKAFGWIDLKHTDQLIGYKYLHHDLVKGVMHVNKSGLFKAMADLLVSSCPDKKAVYDHLVQHYKDLGLTAPELKEGDEVYSKDQFDNIVAGGDGTVKDPDPEPEQPTEPADLDQAAAVGEQVKTALEEFTSSLKEIDACMKVRMQVIVHMLEDISVNLAQLTDKPKEVGEPAIPKSLQTDIGDAVNKLKELFDFSGVKEV